MKLRVGFYENSLSIGRVIDTTLLTSAEQPLLAQQCLRNKAELLICAIAVCTKQKCSSIYYLHLLCMSIQILLLINNLKQINQQTHIKQHPFDVLAQILQLCVDFKLYMKFRQYIKNAPQYQAYIQSMPIQQIFQQYSQVEYRNMLQSFSRKGLNAAIMLQCYRCKQKPDQQFILLLCDHMICSSCLNKFSSMRSNGFQGIKCPCGVLTYFKVIEDNQVRKYISANQTNQEDEQDSYALQQQESSNGTHRDGFRVNINQSSYLPNHNKSNRPSAGIIHSKNTSSTKNISRLNTQTFSRVNTESHNYISDNTPDYFRDKLMLQQSKYPLQTNKKNNKTKKLYQQPIDSRNLNASHQMIAFSSIHNAKCNQRKIRTSHELNAQHCPRSTHYEPEYIESESLTSQGGRDKQNSNPNLHPKRKFKKQSNPKSLKTQQYYLQEEPSNSQEQQSELSGHIQKRKARNTWHENQLSQQLKSQIKYMQISHKKLLQSLERAYQRALKKINDDYGNLENNLKDLCLQNIVMDRSESHIDFGRIVKMRYETYIAKNVQKLTQQIKAYGYKDGMQYISNQTSKMQQTNRDVPKIRLLQPQRFSSPQLQRLNAHTEPASIYTGSQLFSNSYHKNISYNNAHLTNINPQSQQFKPQRYLQTIHSPVCQHSQPSNKLQKKGIKRRTNVIIQL